MAVRHKEHHVLLNNRQGAQGGNRGIVDGKGQIIGLIQQLGHNHGVVVLVEPEGDIWVFRRKIVEEVGQEIIAHLVNKGQSDGIGGTAELEEGLPSLHQRSQRLVHIEGEVQPVGREHRAPPLPLKQRDAQLLLQLADGVAQVGLGGMEGLRRL